MRRAVRADLDEITAIWVEAFDSDPYFRWLAPADDVYDQFGPHWFGFCAGHVFDCGHTFLADGAAIAWIPPDVTFLDADGVAAARDLIASYAGETRANEALDVIMRTRGHGLEEPHWTLQFIGARAAQRGTGVGKVLAAPGLATIDADALPCELVSTNPRNVTFYERLGFSVHAAEPSTDGTVTLRSMRRPASPASS